jgi:DNA-binding response OmpR family regulator
MSTEQKKILVIDDEPDVRTYLTTLLEDNGYTVDSAKDGQEGWEKFQQDRPALVTLDITMPEKSGVRFYRDVKENEEFKATPIIIITGVSTDFEKFISTRKKVPAPEGYIPKPVDQNALLAKVKELIG